MASMELADAYAEGQDPTPTWTDAERVTWQARLQAALAAARESHPGVEVDVVAWCRHLGRSLPPDASPDDLHVDRAADLYLAFACGEGEAKAIDRLRTRFSADVDRALAKAGSTGIAPAELRQRAWVKLLADGGHGEPHIRRYSGRGSLQGWIRVVVSRLAVDLLRGARETERERTVAPEVLAEIGRTDPDPQFEILRAQYHAEVRGAMEAAFAALSSKDRRLLRGQLVERLGTDDLGAMFGVHRTTAARWVERARARLIEHAHAALRERVGAGDQTVRSLVQMVRSQIDLSVARLLQTDPGD
jgi:RNA polymerase sigma-70 factor (ECF subfamily)